MNAIRLAIVLAAATLFASAPLAAAAADPNDAVEAAKAFMTAFNRGDGKALAATCASQASIVDDFAPHHWQGPGACADWWSAFVESAKSAGYSGETVTLGAPLVTTIDGSTAYIVFPSTFTYAEKGKPMKETGSMWTVALQKFASGWRIVGWAWSQTHS